MPIHATINERTLRRSVCGKSASPDCDKEAVAQFQMP